MDNNKETFEYTYSAAQQEEIEKIRRKYMPKEETQNKMELLRKLDKDVTKPGTIWSIVIGVIGCLIFGTGMSCIMVGPGSLFIIGIVVGLIGLVMMAAALPVYKKITQKEQERIAPQILALTEELIK